MAVPLLQVVQAPPLSLREIASKTELIHQTLLTESENLDAANFTRIGYADLERMFQFYDERFFAGTIQQALGSTPLTFRLSKRMTSAGGKTSSYWERDRKSYNRFEIAFSAPLLFECFRDEPDKPLVTSGIVCRDRLAVMQRVMEHELIHLIEMLLWKESSCAQSRFQQICRAKFHHTEHKHRLITPREAARKKYGIQTGDRVQFHYEGRHHTGIVNRITRRATVLVEDPSGERYSNGQSYKKFYVPLEQLQPISD